ncbi:MAG: hypothetical protein WB586_08190 [Chthoniobacterales bacterium]
MRASRLCPAGSAVNPDVWNDHGKIAVGAELNTAICAGVVFLSRHKHRFIDLAVASVVTKLALLAILALLTTLL